MKKNYFNNFDKQLLKNIQNIRRLKSINMRIAHVTASVPNARTEAWALYKILATIRSAYVCMVSISEPSDDAEGVHFEHGPGLA